MFEVLLLIDQVISCTVAECGLLQADCSIRVYPAIGIRCKSY